MQKVKWTAVLLVWLAAGNLLAQGRQQVVDTEDAPLVVPPASRP